MNYINKIVKAHHPVIIFLVLLLSMTLTWYMSTVSVWWYYCIMGCSSLSDSTMKAWVYLSTEMGKCYKSGGGALLFFDCPDFSNGET